MTVEMAKKILFEKEKLFSFCFVFNQYITVIWTTYNVFERKITCRLQMLAK